MSDFSLFSLFTAGLAFATSVSAYTKPVGASPEGNPISQPGFMSIVPVGEPFSVTWEPTTQGTVTLVLLKGPPENAVPQYAIAEKIDNSGVYAWTPKDNLEPTADATGYGIQLIVDSNGQYQYTTQFGISNPDYSPEPTSSSKSSAAPTPTGGYGGGSNGGPPHGGDHGPHGGPGGYTWSASATGSMSSSYTHKGNGTASASKTKSTPYATQNVTMIAPTGGYVTSTKAIGGGVSTSQATYEGPSATSSGVPQATDNAASSMLMNFGGLVVAAGAAVLVL